LADHDDWIEVMSSCFERLSLGCAKNQGYATALSVDLAIDQQRVTSSTFGGFSAVAKGFFLRAGGLCTRSAVGRFFWRPCETSSLGCLIVMSRFWMKRCAMKCLVM